MPQGIDISEFNGNLNLWNIKPDFVIIRAGDGSYIDCDLYENIEQCIEHNIPYGLYWLIRDWSIASAEKTAANLCRIADNQKVKPSVGIWCDVEGEYDDEPSQAIPYVDAFCRTVEDCGYYAGIYCNMHYHDNLYPALDRFDCWIAYWDEDPYDDPGYGTMKQYSTSKGRLDLDVCFVPLSTYQIQKEEKPVIIDPIEDLYNKINQITEKLEKLEEKLK